MRGIAEKSDGRLKTPVINTANGDDPEKALRAIGAKEGSFRCFVLQGKLTMWVLVRQTKMKDPERKIPSGPFYPGFITVTQRG
jgi:hypothetical protein